MVGWRPVVGGLYLQLVSCLLWLVVWSGLLTLRCFSEPPSGTGYTYYNSLLKKYVP